MIAYLSQNFPSLTTSFVYREVVALKNRGVPVATFSLWRPHIDDLDPETRRIAEETTHLFPTSWWRLANQHLVCAVRHPLAYVKNVAFLFGQRGERFNNLYKTWAAMYAAPIMEQLNVQHIHAHFAAHPASVAMVASDLTGTSFSFTAHAVDIFVHRIMLPTKLQRARFVIAISEYNKHVMAELAPEAADKIHVVHCGVDVNDFVPTSPPHDEPLPIILAVGQMREKKGFLYLVQACQQLVQQGVRFRCIIVGGGEGLSTLQNQISQAGLNGQIILTGPLFQADVRAWLRRASIFVLPCVVAADGDQDGIPVSLMEAMAMELPVVSTTISGIPELIEHEREGLLVPPRDSIALANALSRLITDSILCQSLGIQARRKIVAEFDLGKNAEKLIDIFAHYGVLR